MRPAADRWTMQERKIQSDEGRAEPRREDAQARNKSGLRRFLRDLAAWFLYWVNTPGKKDEALWIFAGFNKRSYLDNSRYFYEYVLERHPEIKAYWITLDPALYERLHKEGKPVLMMRTARCRRIVSRAAIAVTDHYRMSDYDAFSGLNDRLKIVQLWHGVGLKTMRRIIEKTEVPGLRFSEDLFRVENGVRRRRPLRWFLYAPHRELFEDYFLLLCPGQERVRQIAQPLHIPLDRCFFSGHPRNRFISAEKPDPARRRILYAPTFRLRREDEEQLLERLRAAAPEIQAAMERLYGELTVRLHPHTWRNYSEELAALAARFSRIRIDGERDVYPSLGRYEVMISDYSSIAFDYLLLDRPIVFFGFDRERYVESEGEINCDYDSFAPGTHTRSWGETLTAVEAYLDDPAKDGDWRRRVRDEIYEMSVNDEQNSERIVQEIKRRLAEKRVRT